MRICVIGAGAIGGLLAIKLAQAGHIVSVVARGANLLAIQNKGFKLIAEDGTESITHLKATDIIRDLGPQDLVILGMKAHQLAAVVHDIASLYHENTMVLTAQNGIPWWYFISMVVNMMVNAWKVLTLEGKLLKICQLIEL